MSLRGFLVFVEIFIILDVAKSFPVQQERLDGANVKNAWKQSSYTPVVPGNKGSGGTEFQKTTSNSLFSCFDLDICRTGLDFCNERRKACEKCEDYERTCGSNIQPVGCTKYCVDLLVAKKLQEIEEAFTSVTSEKPPESKQKSEPLGVKWIVIGIMSLIIIVLLVIIGCRECKRKQSAAKEKPETQFELLGNDVETSVEEPSLSYSSVPLQHDNAAVSLPIPSAPSMPQEISDLDQTKPKMKKNRDKCVPSTYQGPEIGDLSQGRQQQADESFAEKKNSADIQQREVEDDEPTSSGYSSALSTPSHSRQGSALVTNNITINLNTNVPNVVSTSSSEETTLVEDPNKNIPFGKQESGKTESAISLCDVPYKNQLKPVSDENKFTQIALRDNTIDFTSDENKLQEINVT